MKGDQKKKALKEITETEKLLAKVDSNKTRCENLSDVAYHKPGMRHALREGYCVSLSRIGEVLGWSKVVEL